MKFWKEIAIGVIGVLIAVLGYIGSDLYARQNELSEEVVRKTELNRMEDRILRNINELKGMQNVIDERFRIHIDKAHDDWKRIEDKIDGMCHG